MQYRTFRVNLPYMGILLVAHPLVRRLWEKVFNPQKIRDAARRRLEQRTSFDFLFGHIFLFVLHGFSSFKIMFILFLNYQIATKLPRKYVPAVTWVFNIAMLFATEIYKGFSYEVMAWNISPHRWDGAKNEWMKSGLMVCGEWLDRRGGIIPRWQILFNFSILRLISFNLDYCWSLDGKNADALEVSQTVDLRDDFTNVLKKKQLDPANLSERDRIAISPPLKDFGWKSYIGYCTYAPLYLVGPILSFNDYISQSTYKVASIEMSRTIRYGIRFVLVLLSMEFVLHFSYVGAISNSDPVWSSYSAAQLCLLSFVNLHIIWLKLLLPWRLHRLWALLDGVDPPENMVRCVSNNFSTQNFWRAWHRSYNRWLIRYIYVPLGGSSFATWFDIVKSILTFLMVFTFVALWHDLQLRLLIWGWLIVLFMIPEWTAAYFFPARKWENRPKEYRFLCGFGAVLNVLMMISANMVGFAVGLDGLQSIIQSVLHEWSGKIFPFRFYYCQDESNYCIGIIFLLSACACLFVGVQVMFEIRESEKRKGVDVRC